MTGETGAQSSTNSDKRQRLNRLLRELQDLDSNRKRLQGELKFEREKELQEAYREDRQTRRTQRANDLRAEIRRIGYSVDSTVAEIGELVFDLGLVGVNLW